ncbi:MAG: hypothetical protein ACKOWK_01675 [Micrococcales bacterium]
MNFEEFWKAFTAVERSSKAVAARFSGVQLYPLLRTRIFYAVAQELGLFDNPHPNFAKPELEEGLPPLPDLEQLPRVDAVIVPFRRRVAGGEPYSDAIIERLKAEGKSFRIIDFDFNAEAHAADPTELDLGRLRELFTQQYTEQVNKNLRITSRENAENRWTKIVEAFEGSFDIKLEKFQKYPKYLVRRTLIDQLGFAKLFKDLGAKELYIVNAYSEPSLVLAGKRAGLTVTEIQHGFISKYHPAYSYPRVGLLRRHQRVDSVANRIATWGRYWGSQASGVQLPAGTSAVVTGPTIPFAEYRAKALAENRIVPKQVLFTSQGAIGGELFKAAVGVARALADHSVIYRLHPNESLDDYRALGEAIAAIDGPLPANFSISHRDPIFLDLVSRSEYLIGAFSTTLFEGLALGCKVLVLPLSGYENVQPAIDGGDLTLISNLEALPEFLAAAKPASDPFRYYAQTSAR